MSSSQVARIFAGTRHFSPEQHESVTFSSAKRAVRHVALSGGTKSFAVYVGVTILALCGPVGVLVGFEATKFLSATGGGLLIAVASGTFFYCALPDLLQPALLFQ